MGGLSEASVHSDSSCRSVALETSHPQRKVSAPSSSSSSSISRMFVFCIFLTVHLEEFFLFAGLHYLLMLTWLLLIRTNFCGSIDGVRRSIKMKEGCKNIEKYQPEEEDYKISWSIFCKILHQENTLMENLASSCL